MLLSSPVAGLLALSSALLPLAANGFHLSGEPAPRFPHLEARAEIANLNDTREIEDLVADWRMEWNIASGGSPRKRGQSRNLARMPSNSLLFARQSCLSSQVECSDGSGCCDEDYPKCCTIAVCCAIGYSCCSLSECCASGYVCSSGECVEDVTTKTVTTTKYTTSYYTRYTTTYGTTTRSYKTTSTAYRTVTISDVKTATSTHFVTRTTTVTETDFRKRDVLPATVTTIPDAPAGAVVTPAPKEEPAVHIVDRHPHFDPLASKLVQRGAVVKRGNTTTYTTTVWSTVYQTWTSIYRDIITKYTTRTYSTTYTRTEYDSAEETEHVTSTIMVTEQVLVQVSTAPGTTVEVTETAEVIGSSIAEPTDSSDGNGGGGNGGSQGGDESGWAALPLGGKIGIGVGAGLGVLFIMALLGVMWRKYRHSKSDESMLNQPYTSAPAPQMAAAQSGYTPPTAHAAVLASVMAAGGKMDDESMTARTGVAAVPMNQRHYSQGQLSHATTAVSPGSNGHRTPGADGYFTRNSRINSGAWSPPPAPNDMSELQQFPVVYANSNAPESRYSSPPVPPQQQQQQHPGQQTWQAHRSYSGHEGGQGGGYFPPPQRSGGAHSISPPQGYSEMAGMNQGHDNTAAQEVHGYSAPPAGYAEMGSMAGRESSPVQEMYAGEHQNGRFHEAFDHGRPQHYQ